MIGETELAKKRLAETQEEISAEVSLQRYAGREASTSVVSIKAGLGPVGAVRILGWTVVSTALAVRRKGGSCHQAHSLSLCYAHVGKLLVNLSAQNRTWVVSRK